MNRRSRAEACAAATAKPGAPDGRARLLAVGQRTPGEGLFEHPCGRAVRACEGEVDRGARASARARAGQRRCHRAARRRVAAVESAGRGRRAGVGRSPRARTHSGRRSVLRPPAPPGPACVARAQRRRQAAVVGGDHELRVERGRRHHQHVARIGHGRGAPFQRGRREQVQRAGRAPAGEVAPRRRAAREPGDRQRRRRQAQPLSRRVHHHGDLLGHLREDAGQRIARGFKQFEHGDRAELVVVLVTRLEVKRARLGPGHSPTPPIGVGAVASPAGRTRRRPADERRERSTRSPRRHARTPHRRAPECPRTGGRGRARATSDSRRTRP